MSVYKIDAEPRETGTAPNGKAYVRIAYYMQNLDAQKKWKLIPGAVLGDTPEEAMEKAKAISDQLDGLTVNDMAKNVNALMEAGKMVKHLRHLK